MATPDYFPVETRVVLKGLVKAPDLNGKVGIVKTGLASGRQTVLIEELSKSVALKVSNLSFEGRTVESLSVKELKAILRFKANITADSELTGIDMSELQSKVANLKGTSPEKLAQWLAESRSMTTSDNAPTTTTTTSSTSSSTTPANSSVNPAQAADQLSNMNPEQLRQQARMMRSMPPDQIRRMNPQLAHMTDAQIQAAAGQMEMMASNPAMMKMATDQIKNMSPEDVKRAQEQAMGSGAAAAGSRPAAASSQSAPSTSNMATPASAAAAPSTADQAAQANQMMANMSPEQLRQQADMFESMSPDAIRKMNPQLAHMTNDQVKMAATQFRMMADNPDMMKMAMDQMKNMSPEQIAAIKNGQAAPPGANPMMGAGGGDPSQMLANMDKEQLKNMLKTMKENPDMMKQFASSSGLGEDQLAQGVEMFAEMDDSKLDMALNMMQKAQKAKDVYTSVDSKTGGHLKKIIIGVSVLAFGYLVLWLFLMFSGTTGGAPVLPTTTDDIPNIAVKEAAAVEDEFASEF